MHSHAPNAVERILVKFVCESTRVFVRLTRMSTLAYCSHLATSLMIIVDDRTLKKTLLPKLLSSTSYLACGLIQLVIMNDISVMVRADRNLINLNILGFPFNWCSTVAISESRVNSVSNPTTISVVLLFPCL